MVDQKCIEDVIRRYYEMMFPQELFENEYIRLVAIRNSTDGTKASFTRYVRTFEEYLGFVMKYRQDYDLFNQIATNKGNQSGTAENQWRRRVLFLDFDCKDQPEMRTAKDCREWIKSKLPKLFVHCIINSGHGFHFYVCVPETDEIDDLISMNETIAQITKADLKAVMPTQISRIPGSYNHKTATGADYKSKDEWSFVKVVINSYGDNRYRALDSSYIQRMISEYQYREEVERVLDKTVWHYEYLDDYPQYLCIRRAIEEGVDKGQRNFWLGRIVKMLQKQGYTQTAILRECQSFNKKCRPPKSEQEIEKDTQRFLNGEYHLLGCYEAFPESDPRRRWVYEMCDKAHCASHHAGVTATIEGAPPAKINRKVLSNKELRDMDGIYFLVLTVMDVYVDSYGRRGFRVRDLEKLLHSSVAKQQCVSYRRLKTILRDLEQKKYIEILPDAKKPSEFGLSKLKIARRLKEFQQGYVWFYFSIANAVIDGKISQTDYRVFLALARNLQTDNKAVTYAQLADDLQMDINNIGKSIRKLRDERCLIIYKGYTERGYEFNRYQFTDPVIFECDFQETDNEVISLIR